MKELAADLQKGRSHLTAKDSKHVVRFPRLIRRFPRLPIRRFPRRNAEDVARFRQARLFAVLENRAHNWIGRGRPANLKLGRLLLRLKDFVGHGNFLAYYKHTFEKRDGIPLRTAQDYMKMARLEVTKYAESAQIKQADDPQATEIRAANEKHRLAVEAAKSKSSDETSASSEERHPGRSTRSDESLCICRPSIPVTPTEKTRIAALWASDRRTAAEAAVRDVLLEQCREYEKKHKRIVSEGSDD